MNELLRIVVSIKTEAFVEKFWTVNPFCRYERKTVWSRYRKDRKTNSIFAGSMLLHSESKFCLVFLLLV